MGDGGGDDDRDGAAAVDEIAGRLHRIAPEEFVAARDEAVAEARAAGDRALAREIAAFKRPTRAAWLANLLALEQPDDVEGLLELAGPLAEAQQSLDGAALRQVSAQRSTVVGGLARRAARLGRDAGHRVDSALERDVRAVLEAALAEPELAARLRSGRLVRAERYSGFGTFGADDAPPAAPAAGRTGSRVEGRARSAERGEPTAGPRDRSAGPRDRSAEPPDRSAERRDRSAERRERERATAEERERQRRDRARVEARDRVERARLAAHDAGRERDDARERADAAAAARDAAHRRVDELREEIDRARTSVGESERALRSAERDADDAARRARRADAEVANAEVALDDLPSDDPPDS